MRSSSPRLGLPWLFLFLFLFAAQVVPNLFENSPTADEPGDLTAGYFYWQGDVLSDNAHPPLAKALQALPLKAFHLQVHLDPWAQDYLARNYDFFFVLNRSQFEPMLWSGRFVSLLFGLGLGILLFFSSSRAAPVERLAVMTLFTFEPTLLAFSGLAVSDLPVTFFFFAAVLAFQKHLESPGPKWALIAGFLTAMAAGCKFSALALLPLFLILEFLNHRPKSKNRFRPFLDWASGAVAFLAFLFILYLPGSLRLTPPALPWSYFLAGLFNMAGQTHAFHATYFWGEAGRQNHWLYYPAAFLLKNTLPFLILLFLGALLAVRKKISIQNWEWIPAFLFFLFILPVQNLGVRYLLPATPFFILLAARAAAWLWNLKPKKAPRSGKLITAGLLTWSLATAFVNNANLISYFNDFVPDQKKVYLLGDSNLDWGQDEKRLSQAVLQKGWTRLKLAQFGGADLALYGLKAQSWSEKDLKGPQPGFVYLVNLGFLQLGPVFDPDLEPLAQGWMAALPPTGRIGDTWLYWEIPGNPGFDSSKPIASVRTAGLHYQEEIRGLLKPQ
jgi:hypothetical protein